MLDRLFGDQASHEHHGRIGCIGAGGHCRDDNVAVLRASGATAWGAVRLLHNGVATGANRLSQGVAEFGLQLRQRYTVLRPLGAGEVRLYRCQIKINHLRVIDVARHWRAKATLRAEISFHGLDVLR